jgi:para-aminobenzoate synthetase component 1
VNGSDHNDEQSERLAPWSLFAPHEERPFSFLLDRAGTSAPSFAGSSPSRQLVVRADGTATIWNGARWSHVAGHPIRVIDAFVDECRREVRSASADVPTAWPLPRTVGYLAYELGRWIEEIPAVADDPVGMPLAVLSTYDRVDAWDPAHRRVVHVEFDAGAEGEPPRSPTPGNFRATTNAIRGDAWKRDRYRNGFATIKAAIGRGDIYQANLSRRISRTSTEAPAAVYRRMRARQPVPQGAYLELDGFALLSNSPECFLRIHDESIDTFPIKGTRPRHGSRALDDVARTELTRDPKELAEHVMIVDLERNDLGRVCRTGTVDVPSFAAVRSFATVHHLVSRVNGRLRPDCGLAAVLEATFPGGSITGAPKIKAMELIAAVEPTARGVYTGAIGSFNGPRSVELNVAIRTAVSCGGYIHYSSGGGIVADSNEPAEYEETVTKARAFLDSLLDGNDAPRAATI